VEGAALFGVVAMIAIAAAAIGSATAQGRTAAAAMDALWRQPEIAGQVFTSMVLAFAFMEALAFVLLGAVS